MLEQEKQRAERRAEQLQGENQALTRILDEIRNDAEGERRKAQAGWRERENLGADLKNVTELLSAKTRELDDVRNQAQQLAGLNEQYNREVERLNEVLRLKLGELEQWKGNYLAVVAHPSGVAASLLGDLQQQQ